MLQKSVGLKSFNNAIAQFFIAFLLACTLLFVSTDSAFAQIPSNCDDAITEANTVWDLSSLTIINVAQLECLGTNESDDPNACFDKYFNNWSTARASYLAFCTEGYPPYVSWKEGKKAEFERVLDRILADAADGDTSLALTPRPTRAPSEYDLVVEKETEIVKCGLEAAGYRCCMPNEGGDGLIEPGGSFFDSLRGLWEGIMSAVGSSAANRAKIGRDELHDAVFDGGLQLCPRSEEGPRGERFVDISDTERWLDQRDEYDMRPEASAEAELQAYEELLFGTGESGVEGIVGVIRTTKAPATKIEYGGKTYGCFCVNTETELERTVDYYLGLEANARVREEILLAQGKQGNVREGEGAVLAAGDVVDVDGLKWGAGKICRNIESRDEREKCERCVQGKDIETGNEETSELGGAWTAVGCIYADFSSALENQLFPLFIMIGGIVSLGCIMYAAFMMQVSMGNPEKVTNAQSLMTSCITGLILIIFSVFILRVIGVDVLRLPGLSAPEPTPTVTLPTPTP